MGLDASITPRARIACLTGSADAQNNLTIAFAEAGYAVVCENEADHADLGVVDLRKRDITAKQAQQITSALRKRSPECAIFFLINPHMAPKGRAILKRSGEVVAIEEDLAPAIERCRQMLRLRDLAEEAGERLKTLASLSRLADFPTIETSNEAPRILIAGKPSRYALAAASAASEIAGQWSGVISAGQALRALETGNFDCAIFLPDTDNDLLLSLARSIQRHQKHEDLSIIHIAQDQDHLDELASKGVRDFMLAGHLYHDMAQKILTSTRRARLSAAMRRFLNACAGDGVRDTASGAFTASFLSQHGARLCARADQTRRPVCVVIMKLSSRSLSTEHTEPNRRALYQAARLISRVTRAEDMIARLSPDTFIAILPATQAHDASAVANRIEGVIANTMFRGAKSEELFSVKVAHAVIARSAGACIEETIAQALGALRDKPASTTPYLVRPGMAHPQSPR